MKKILPILLLSVLLFAGCTDAGYSNAIGSLGSEHKVTLYSGGKTVGEWYSTGKVLTEERSDGYIFRDKKTKRLMRISGTAAIEQLN